MHTKPMGLARRPVPYIVDGAALQKRKVGPFLTETLGMPRRDVGSGSMRMRAKPRALR